MSKFTVAEMLRRENFRQRFEAGEGIYLHEFLYAVMQGYDAYALGCDVQVGGTEQLFNLMAGRKIQEDAGQRPHVPVTLPILVGLDGKTRMSKSAGNHIGVNDPPDEQYGKAMSLPDAVIMDFFTLAANVPRDKLPALAAEVDANPMAAKKRLARTIVSEFWGDTAAQAAEERFERTVQRGEVPEEIPNSRSRMASR
jgi:tyrosyl-tRNA synthetase